MSRRKAKEIREDMLKINTSKPELVYVYYCEESDQFRASGFNIAISYDLCHKYIFIGEL